MSIPGEGHENFTHEPSDDGDLTGLDKEWYDFQQQQDQAPDAGSRAREVLAKLVIEEINKSIKEYNLPRVVDDNPETNILLGIQYIDAHREKAMEELEWSEDGISDKDILHTVINAFKAYHDRREAETTLLYCAVSYKLKDLLRDNELIDDVHMQDMKSNLMAHFQVQYKLEPEWLQFFHDITNDGGSTPYYTMIEQYHLDTAWEGLPEFLSEKEQKWQVLDRALALVDFESIENDIEYAVSLTAAAIDMMEIASEPIENESDRANRNELLWESGRESGLDNETIKKLADYFDGVFPVQD